MKMKQKFYGNPYANLYRITFRDGRSFVTHFSSEITLEELKSAFYSVEDLNKRIDLREYTTLEICKLCKSLVF